MTIYELTDVLTYLAPLGLITGIIIGIVKRNTLKNNYLILVAYLVVAFITDFVSRIIPSEHGNLILLPLFSMAEIALFTLFYQHYFSGLRRTVIIAMGVALTLTYFGQIYPYMSGSALYISTFSNLSSPFGIVFFSFLLFLEHFNGRRDMDRELFLLNSILLVYFSLKLFFYVPLAFFIHVQSDIKFYFWFIHLTVTILFYILLVRFLWKNGQTAI